jgi:hypothetical protein
MRLFVSNAGLLYNNTIMIGQQGHVPDDVVREAMLGLAGEVFPGFDSASLEPRNRVFAF